MFELVPNTLKTFNSFITTELKNVENGQLFVLKLEALIGSTFHFEIDEKTPLKPRYRVIDALKQATTPEK